MRSGSGTLPISRGHFPEGHRPGFSATREQSLRSAWGRSAWRMFISVKIGLAQADHPEVITMVLPAGGEQVHDGVGALFPLPDRAISI